MFSIIDNEIKFKIEILGGYGFGAIGTLAAPAPVIPVDSLSVTNSKDVWNFLQTIFKKDGDKLGGNIKLGLSDLVEAINKMDDQAIQKIVTEIVVGKENVIDRLKTEMQAMFSTPTSINLDFLNIRPTSVVAQLQAPPIQTVVTVPTPTVTMIPAVAQNVSIGGNLNEALSKDIQLKLIGGYEDMDSLSYLLGDPIYYALFLAIYTNPDPVFTSLIPIVDKYFKPVSGNTKQFLSSYKQGDLTGKKTDFNEIVTFDANKNLQVKLDDGSFVSLEKYWTSSKSYALNKDLKSDDDKIAYLNCFVKGEKIFNDDGSIAAQNCYNLIKKQEFYKIEIKDIIRIHPKVALGILNSLDIKGEKDKNGLIVVKSYEDWWNNLPKVTQEKLGPVKDFKNADFIRNIIAFVNANPKMINKGDVQTNERDIYGPHAALFNFKKTMTPKITYGLNTYLNRLMLLTGDKIFGALPVIGVNSVGGSEYLEGGAILSSLSIPGLSNNKLENFPKFSKQLRNAFRNLKNKLNYYNKTLGKITESKIEEIFTNLEKHEDEAYELVKQIEYYYLNMKITNDKSSQTVSDEAVSEAKTKLKEHIEKINKRSINLVDIAAAYGLAIADQQKSSSNSGIDLVLS